ncbi:MAG: SCO family protein [Polyangiaceae bacterium]|nr:SCO family protein [Polyangiaceae bacterium]
MSAAVVSSWLKRAERAVLCALLLVLALTAAPTTAFATELGDATPSKPKRLNGIDVDEHLDTDLPLDLAFTDSDGKPVKLGDFFDGERPVIITLNYSDCPMLCSLQLTGLVKGMKQMDWTAGKDFRVVTVSLNPKEKPERSAETKKRYVTEYGRPDAQAGWHFLTGSEDNIKALANAIGFRYGYNEVRKEYVHPAALTLATPNGKIARYLYGIEYHPKTLRLGLVESSEGKIGSTVDKLILYCFHYDSGEGKYAPVAMNIMQVAGGATALLLGGVLSSLWANEFRKRRKRDKNKNDPQSADDESTNSDQES